MIVLPTQGYGVETFSSEGTVARPAWSGDMDVLDLFDDEPTAFLVEARAGEEAVRLLVHGEVDGVNAGRLQRAVIDVLRRQRPSCIDIDFRSVSFLDSTGIHVLVMCQADARQLGCSIRLTGLRPMVYRSLEITGLADHFGATAPEPHETS